MLSWRAYAQVRKEEIVSSLMEKEKSARSRIDPVAQMAAMMGQARLDGKSQLRKVGNAVREGNAVDTDTETELARKFRERREKTEKISGQT